ncbi:MAG: hypothetical protein H7329_01970 [Opitutaceae bacterium]|nr:hypothetical protein [Cytophagales bacterium]
MKAIRLLIVTSVIITKTAFSSNQDSTDYGHKFRVGIDFFKPFSPILKTDGNNNYIFRGKFELLTAYRFYSGWHVNLDLGYGKGEQHEYFHAQQYKAEGFYLKPGLEYNVLHRENETRRISFIIGYRLGLSSYNVDNKYVIKSKFWDTEYVEEQKERGSTYWHETLLNLRVNLMKLQKTGISLGFTTRVRYMPQVYENSRLYIPGYGGNNPINLATNIDVSMFF